MGFPLSKWGSLSDYQDYTLASGLLVSAAYTEQTAANSVMGDMALAMVSQGLTPAEVADPSREIAFPSSVVEMMRGDLGRPSGGWPAALQAKVLKGEKPLEVRPGSLLPDEDLTASRVEAARRCGRAIDDQGLASWLMYPEVFSQFCSAKAKYGPVWALPTSAYFYGLEPGDEIAADRKSVV